LHSVDPPNSLQAVPGNAQVELSWLPGSTPGVTYDLYRTSYLPSGLYFKLNGAPLSTTSFTDDTAVNATTYHYYVVAVDGEGFESAWSNFNTDCAVQGADCVEATPLNPDPPQVPTGVVLTDPGIGDRLRLDWNPNPEDDLDYYTVRYGTVSGVYTVTEQVDRFLTSYTMTGLIEGQDYFVVLSATNTSGQRSPDTDELSDYPSRSPGLRVPAFIADLRVVRSGDDLVLEWDEVVEDVYGKPKQVQRYEIFRASGGAFVSDGLTKIGECDSPCGSWPDQGAAKTAESYRYRVRAIDADGNEGGLGSELPGYTELSVERSATTEGAIVLRWVPVTLALDGTPARLSHYAIYAAELPFTRADIRDGLLPAPMTVTDPWLEYTPPTQTRYYSVLAVDVWGNVSPY
jgi:hypothetical protein